MVMAMLSGSLVFIVDSPIANFYDTVFEKWIHYIPVK